MMTVRFFALAVLIGQGLVSTVLAEEHPLLPHPQKIRYDAGQLPLSEVTISLPAFAAEEDRFAARALADELSRRLGKVVALGGAGPGGGMIRLERTGAVDPLPLPDEGPGPDSREAYRLRITPQGAAIHARSSAGIFYGIQTLVQLIEGEGQAALLPAVEIDDWPSLAYRGTMVDMSHGPLLTEAEVKRQIDFLARWKANQYYFYSECSIELEGYPLLNPTGRFSRDAVRRIIVYARERHIDVIPCLELYGHLHDLFRVEKYADLAAFPHGSEFKPGNPKVMELLTDWAGQYVELFPSPFVHVGFDETMQIEMAARQEGLGATAARLFRTQLDNVAGLFMRRGRRVMAWGDIMVKYPEVVAELPPGLIGVAWEYDPRGDYAKWLNPLAAKHVPTIMATAVSNCGTLCPDYDYSLANVDAFLQAGRKVTVLGLMNTVWSDSSQSLMRAAWPAMAYGAAAAWQSEPLDRPHFFRDYSRVTYPAGIADDVAGALERLARAEVTLQKALGQDSITTFWDDPFERDLRQRAAEHRADLRQTRLLAEDAEERLDRALRHGGDPVTLNCLLINSRLLDYAGLKFLTAVEAADRWQALGPRAKAKTWWQQFDSEWTYQSHSHVVDLMDQITELRKQYRAAWLAEYTDYRLESTLGRWDAEYEYWRKVQLRFRAFSRKLRDNDLLPSIESVIASTLPTSP